MADQSSNTPPTSAAPQNPPNSTRGNRRRGRGGGPPPMHTDTHQRRGRGGRGGGGRGGRGGGPRDGGGQTRAQGPNPHPIRTGQLAHDDNGGEPPGPDPRSLGTSGDRLTGAATRAQGEGAAATAAATTEEADDGEVCFICASNIAHTAVAPCNHRTCHICALRLRALYKTKACAHCRTEWPFVIFTDDPAKRYEDYKDKDFIRTDDNLGIKYETNDIFEDTVLLLRYNCPDDECDAACLGWPDLHRHVKSRHQKVMCDLCTRNKKVFTHEHELFSMTQLRKHEKYGDDNPGAVDQSGFKGHPECGFCRQRFYGDDELYAHCRDKHERCHICDRRNGSRQQQYFANYDALEDHFSKDHFICLDKECLEKKFVVFESQMDLKAHQLEAHPAGLSKDARRDARIVDLSSFDYRTPYQPQRGGRGREGRGAGRGRDPNAEPLPASSAQPLRRDELAYQRQMAIQSAQSVTSRTFGGQLTSSNAQTVRVPAQSTAPPPRPPPAAPTTAMESLNLGRTTTPSTPQDQARQIAHQAVVDRAAALLRNDPLKLSDFRNKVSSYRTGTINATYLIESFFSLFDTSSSELGKLIKELAELYEDDTKRNALLKAWNDWRAINEDYPALPGPNGVLSSTNTSTTGGGKRVLRLKSSTAQSSRSAVGRSGSFLGLSNGPSTSTSSSNASPFPPLPAPSRANKTTARSSAMPWSTVTPPSRSAGSSPAPSRPSPSTTTSTTANLPTRTRPANTDAFPALPAAPKPNTLMPGLTRGTVRWDGRASNTGQSPWGRGGINPTPAEAGDEGGDGGDGAGKKGKGKKGKQVLYHFGHGTPEPKLTRWQEELCPFIPHLGSVSGDIEFLKLLHISEQSYLFKVKLQGNIFALKLYTTTNGYWSRSRFERNALVMCPFIVECRVYDYLIVKKASGVVGPHCYGWLSIDKAQEQELQQQKLFNYYLEQHQRTISAESPARWLLLQYIDGCTLDKALLTVAGAESLRYQLSFLHSLDILHSDLCPRNIMATSDGRALLVDFSVSMIWPHCRSTVRERSDFERFMKGEKRILELMLFRLQNLKRHQGLIFSPAKSDKEAFEAPVCSFTDRNYALCD
ncbi:hypothetical protein AJ79_05353 [Helicocarpus griseus UAMH5409]|uniref:RING-type E3 ubiquitin transferase n=1 Tax=Helicocarpus griseus UAMH5409 TaxID=1447875 RepID=A0A2B7XNT7_9EURO|nr:hypothetical protein AJ79_05353 [Helicocarpus griseus UAMH5409]